MDSGLSHELLGVAFGMIVGTSLGLTGGGGSIFAVPLLTYGLGVPVGTALGLSLALFLGGCFAGMLAGSALRSRLSGSALQKTFAVAIWLVAVFMLVKNLSTFVPD
jgi:uncharacterized membrane protein YfcA